MASRRNATTDSPGKQLMLCGLCGLANDSGRLTCSHCGASLARKRSAKPWQGCLFVAAGLLAILTGIGAGAGVTALFVTGNSRIVEATPELGIATISPTPSPSSLATSTASPVPSATSSSAGSPTAQPTVSQTATPSPMPMKSIYHLGETAQRGAVALTLNDNKLTLGTLLNPTARVDVYFSLANTGEPLVQLTLVAAQFIGDVKGQTTGATSVAPANVRLAAGQQLAFQIVFQVRGNPVEFRDVREVEMTAPSIGDLPATRWRLKIR